MSKNTSVLVSQWRHDNKNYRLVAVGDHTPGYQDNHVLEVAAEDSLGGVRWLEVDQWRSAGLTGASDVRTVLSEGIRAAQALAKSSALKSDGWSVPVSSRSEAP